MGWRMKELKRSRTDRMLAGVCGGIGEYLGIDPNVIRLIWIGVSVFTAGAGILAYLLAWLIVPEEALSPPETVPPENTVTVARPETGTIIEIEPDGPR